MAGALDGIRVLEFTQAMAGPWVGRLMAHCGADVIRVESRVRPDVVRLYVPPRNPALGTQPTMSPWFTDWNAGKRFAGLDLARPEAVALAKRLVAVSDVVVENCRGGVIDRLGLGWGALRAVKPDLVMLSSSGLGATGPAREHVTWGQNLEALSGLAGSSGFARRACAITPYAYPDSVSALHGVFAVLCALEHRDHTGEGQHIDLSQTESLVAAMGHLVLETLANGREPQRVGNRSPTAAPQGCYRCAGDDRWCAITVTAEAEWAALCDATGHPEWRADPRFTTLAGRQANADVLDGLLERWTSGRDAYDVMATLQGVGVAAGVVQTAEDLWRHDAQLAARGFFEEIEHLTKGKVVATGMPFGLTGTPGRTGRSGAALGQDNDGVFGGLLGMAPEEIARYVEAGVIETARG